MRKILALHGVNLDMFGKRDPRHYGHATLADIDAALQGLAGELGVALETFQNKHPENDYWMRFNCHEITSLCPITGQPDFAEIRISYIPAGRMVESKSLKLYLFSFRNHGDFHEDCVNVIMKDLVRLMQPKYIEVTGLFTPRGGISIWPYANYGQPGTRYEEMAQYRMLHHDMQ